MTLIEALDATPKTKKVLAELLGTDTRSVELAVQEARLRGLPILSDSEGYRYAQTSEEVQVCAARLRRRAATQFLTARALKRAAVRMKAREDAPLTFFTEAA